MVIFGFEGPPVPPRETGRPTAADAARVSPVPATEPEPPLRQRLRTALPAAMKAGDRLAVSALRATLAALDNAEAVDRTPTADRSLAIEQSPVGVGAAEVARRVLTSADVEHIVRTEVAEREAAAREYDRVGRSERADQLRGEARVLSAHLDGA
jgi:uncharacterized protein YqeY